MGRDPEQVELPPWGWILLGAIIATAIAIYAVMIGKGL